MELKTPASPNRWSSGEERFLSVLGTSTVGPGIADALASSGTSKKPGEVQLFFKNSQAELLADLWKS